MSTLHRGGAMVGVLHILRPARVGSRRSPERRRRRNRPVSVALLVVVSVAGVPAATLFGQQSDVIPSVLVVPAANRSEDSSLDTVGNTVSQTIKTSLQILKEFDVRSLPDERIQPAVISGDAAALERFAEAEIVDYVIFGSVSTDVQDRVVVEVAVWDRSAVSVTLQARQTASSIFETFNVADDLAERFLSAFSGRRIAFGTVQFERNGWDDGSYRVLIDGIQVAVDAMVVTNVLIGNRTVEVIADSGPQTGTVLLEESVTVNEADRVTLAFTVGGPPPAVTKPPPEGPQAETAVLQQATQIGKEPRSLVLRVQGGGGFLGAAGIDVYPGNGFFRTGLVAGGTLLGDEPTPAIAVAAAVEPNVGRLHFPIGVSSYVTATSDAVTAAMGVSLGIGVRFHRVISELFFENIVYLNVHPSSGLPLVYLPVIGVRL